MTILYIILGILGYILIGSLSYIMYRYLVDDDTIFWAIVWPVSLPLYILAIFLMGMSTAIKWLSDKIEGIFKKKDKVF